MRFGRFNHKWLVLIVAMTIERSATICASPQMSTFTTASVLRKLSNSLTLSNIMAFNVSDLEFETDTATKHQ